MTRFVERDSSYYPYARAHVHVRGAFPDGKQAGGLHIPTLQVPLELVLWHLIAEWGVTPKRDDWQQRLEASIDASMADSSRDRAVRVVCASRAAIRSDKLSI